MIKFLPLLCLLLLPLSASALLENATVSVEVLPGAGGALGVVDELFVAAGNRDTAAVKQLLELELAKMPALSGIYVGMIRAREADGEKHLLPQIDLLRIAKIDEGQNRLEVLDEKGVFDVDMQLKAVGHYWEVRGSFGYRRYDEANRQGMGTSATIPEGLTVMPVPGILYAALEPIDTPLEQIDTRRHLTGYFFLRTQDAPSPLKSPENPINRIQYPDGSFSPVSGGVGSGGE